MNLRQENFLILFLFDLFVFLIRPKLMVGRSSLLKVGGGARILLKSGFWVSGGLVSGILLVSVSKILVT